MNYEAIAKKVVERAKRKGAKQAEAWLEVDRESSVKVRDGEVEDLTQATSKELGLRVLVEGRLGFTYTSALDEGRVDEVVERAIAVARVSAPDKNNGFPTKADLKKRVSGLNLFDPQVAELSGDWRIAMAREMERAARDVDPRIKAFEAVSAGDNVSEVWFCSSEGVCDSYRSTSIFLWAAPVAADGDQLQTSYWLDYKRFLSELEPAEAIGRKAAERAVRMLGARKVKTQRVPVVLDPRMAASFIGGIAGAVNGDMVHKKASFLHGKLGKRIAPEAITILDDGLLPRGLGTSPFDGDGVPTRRTPVIEKGVLTSYLYDTFTARKAGAKTTGNAARSYASLPGIGLNNFYLQPGEVAPEELIAEVKQGFYVTAMLGRGANTVTGDYSRGANGIWIENGELAYPVQEVTVAGNMLEMLGAIDGVANDLEFRGSVAAPTIRFAELAVSGS
ncbi:MAG: TldD/PmbA family protein [Myxococcales bacterium]|jgi:PmbA protein